MNEIDPRLVRFVTRHFNDLHGLRTAIWGIVLAVGDWIWLATSSEALAFVTAIACLIAALFLIGVGAEEQYRKLGRVPMTKRARSPVWIVASFVILLNAQRSVSASAPSLVWLAFSLYFLWLAMSGWPWRWYQLLTWASAVYVALARSTVSEADLFDFAWMAPRLWVFALMLIATGTADHFLLVKVMRPTDDAAEEIAS